MGGANEAGTSSARVVAAMMRAVERVRRLPPAHKQRSAVLELAERIVIASHGALTEGHARGGCDRRMMSVAFELRVIR